MTSAELLRRIGRAVIEAGCLWIHIPPLQDADELPPGPPSWHPERCSAGQPLTALERRLQRQLEY